MEASLAGSILSPLGLLATSLALAGAISDLKVRKIPNWLTVGAFLIAILLRALGAGPVGPGLTGAAVAFMVGLALYLVGFVGAGDVKYLAAFGAVLGAGRIWPALLLVALAGGLLALVWSMAFGRATQVLRDAARLGLYCLSLGFFGSRRILSDMKGDAGMTPIPLGVAIAVGCMLVWFL